MLIVLLSVLFAGFRVEELKPTRWEGDPASISDFAIAPDGTLYFTYPGEGKIFCMDLSGNVLRELGKKGEGPNEFQYPSSLYWDGDKLYVNDSGRNMLYRIDPISGKFLASWRFHAVEAFSIQGNHVVASLRIPIQDHIFGMSHLPENDVEIQFKTLMGDIPRSFQIPGAKRSAVLHSKDGNVWVGHTGEFLLTKYSRTGKRLTVIDTPMPDYVLPDENGPVDPRDPISASANVKRFDKIQNLYELGDWLVLFRPKVLNNSYLDLFDAAGKRIASHKSNHLYPIGVHQDSFYAMRVSSGDEDWDMMLVKIHFK